MLARTPDHSKSRRGGCRSARGPSGAAFPGDTSFHPSCMRVARADGTAPEGCGIAVAAAGIPWRVPAAAPNRDATVRKGLAGRDRDRPSCGAMRTLRTRGLEGAVERTARMTPPPRIAHTATQVSGKGPVAPATSPRGDRRCGRALEERLALRGVEDPCGAGMAAPRRPCRFRPACGGRRNPRTFRRLPQSGERHGDSRGGGSSGQFLAMCHMLAPLVASAVPGLGGSWHSSSPSGC